MGKFKGTITCPNCEKQLLVDAKDKVIRKAVPAEKEQQIDVKVVEV